MGRKFFLFCAGANNNILNQLNPPLKESESIRLAGTGVVIFITALFAFLSSCYALSTVFQEEEIKTYLASFLWATFIFSIDRLLISSFIKSNLSNDNLKFFLPRLGLAVIIGLVVAHPLELRIFQDEINEYLENKQIKVKEDKQNNYQNKINNLTHESDIKELKELIKQYENSIDSNNGDKIKLQHEISDAEDIKNCEASGNPHSDVVIGYNERTCDGQRRAAKGPKFRELEREWHRIKSDKEPSIKILEVKNKELEGKISEKQEEISNASIIKTTDLKKRLEEEITVVEKSFSKSLLARSDALFNVVFESNAKDNNVVLAASPAQKDPETHIDASYKHAFSMWVGVILLFIGLEIMPVLMKLLSQRSAYDAEMEKLQTERIVYNESITETYRQTIHQYRLNAVTRSNEMTLAVKANTELKSRLHDFHEFWNNNYKTSFIAIYTNRYNKIIEEIFDNLFNSFAKSINTPNIQQNKIKKTNGFLAFISSLKPNIGSFTINIYNITIAISFVIIIYFYYRYFEPDKNDTNNIKIFYFTLVATVFFWYYQTRSIYISQKHNSNIKKAEGTVILFVILNFSAIYAATMLVGNNKESLRLVIGGIAAAIFSSFKLKLKESNVNQD